MSDKDIKHNNAALLEGNINKTLARLTGPMVLGVLAIFAFNLVDTWFVSMLGTDELAAMGFTLPVIMMIGSITMGLGIGATSAIARAIGGGSTAKVRRLTTDGLILAVSIVAVVVTAGVFTIEPLFGWLGASEEMLPMISDYMLIWYLGSFFLVIPMVGNSAIRATGDVKTPAFIMIGAALLNLILDPIFIFGLGPFEGMGLQGAALATVLTRGVALLATVYILVVRERLIAWSVPRLNVLIASWKTILEVGVPAAATNILMPATLTVLTGLVATFGLEAVAAFGAGARVGSFAMLVPMAMTGALTPFMGQNWGAGRFDRVRSGKRSSQIFAFGWGTAIWLLMILLASPVAGVFGDDPVMVEALTTYLYLVPLGYGAYGVFMVVNATFNAVGKPLRSTALALLRTVALAIPLAWLGAELFGLEGLFVGMALGEMLAAIVAWAWARRLGEVERAALPDLAPALPLVVPEVAESPA